MCQPSPALSASPRDRRSSRTRAHPHPKPVGLLLVARVWLESPLHVVSRKCPAVPGRTPKYSRCWHPGRAATRPPTSTTRLTFPPLRRSPALAIICPGLPAEPTAEGQNGSPRVLPRRTSSPQGPVTFELSSEVSGAVGTASFSTPVDYVVENSSRRALRAPSPNPTKSWPLPSTP